MIMAIVKHFALLIIEDGKLTVDDKHLFTSKTISYNITVVEARDATADELETASKT